MKELLLVSILLPSMAGIILLASAFADVLKKKSKKQLKAQAKKSQTPLHLFVGAILAVSAAVILYTAWSGEKSLTLFTLVDNISFRLSLDLLGSFFVTIVCIGWLAAGLYSFVYMSHEGGEKSFFGWFLMVFGVLVGLCFSGNLVTMYFFFELMTLTSMPLVLHNGSREAIMAALKYLFYSMCGAYGALFGIFFLFRYCSSLDFAAGGHLNMTLVSGHEGILLAAVFAMILGFGVKAGMLPMHAWLPTAHPVAPSPASAVLSAVIAKFGVFAIIRTVFYVVGPEFLKGTWVQYAWMTLALLTVFMGSMLAYREKVFKKRLAYSTVSQVSYVLYGLSVLTADGFTGALFHTLAHFFIKTGLFLTAGVFIFKFGYTKVEELRGLGKKMPILMWSYTFLALALIGIPPTGGFISKWYLAAGSLNSGITFFSWFGPVVLLLSALLTAGYLLPITINGFFPGGESEAEVKEEDPHLLMLLPIVILTTMAVLIGLLPNVFVDLISRITNAVLW